MDNDLNNLTDEMKKVVAQSFDSFEDFVKSREGNKELLGRIMIKDGHESWRCKNKQCNAMIVGDLNGDRAALMLVNGQELFVKFTEMAVRCKNCGTFSYLAFSDAVTLALNETEDGENIGRRFFFLDEQAAAVEAQQHKVPKADIVRAYMLGLK